MSHTLPVPLSGQVAQKLLHYKQVVPDKYIPFGLSHVKQMELDEHLIQGATQAKQVVIPSQKKLSKQEMHNVLSIHLLQGLTQFLHKPESG